MSATMDTTGVALFLLSPKPDKVFGGSLSNVTTLLSLSLSLSPLLSLASCGNIYLHLADIAALLSSEVHRRISCNASTDTSVHFPLSVLPSMATIIHHSGKCHNFSPFGGASKSLMNQLSRCVLLSSVVIRGNNHS